MVEGVDNIREVVINHFLNHFKEVEMVRPGVDGFNFNTISVDERVKLTKPFTKKEVKMALWDCASFKSIMSLDGINFCFNKSSRQRSKLI